MLIRYSIVTSRKNGPAKEQAETVQSPWFPNEPLPVRGMAEGGMEG